MRFSVSDATVYESGELATSVISFKQRFPPNDKNAKGVLSLNAE